MAVIIIGLHTDFYYHFYSGQRAKILNSPAKYRAPNLGYSIGQRRSVGHVETSNIQTDNQPLIKIGISPDDLTEKWVVEL